MIIGFDAVEHHKTDINYLDNTFRSMTNEADNSGCFLYRRWFL